MSIIAELIQIIILKREPQDLTYDQVAAVLAFAGLVAMGYFINGTVGQYSQPFGYSLIQAGAQAIAIYGLLKWKNKEKRFIQTITALFGVTVILQIVTLATLQIISLPILSLFLSIWNFYLMVIILRTALDSSTLQAVLFTIAYHLFMVLVLILIFPDFPKEVIALANSVNAS